MTQASPRQTPLDACHRELGGRMVEFAGWSMAVQYSGVMEEHRAVRGAAGLFDVSHMGEVSVRGPGAEAFLQGLTPNNVARLKAGRAHYSALLNERGTYLDDLLIYRRGADDFLVVINAANVEPDYRWIEDHARRADGVEVANVSDDYALVALQGPRAEAILQGLAELGQDGSSSSLEEIRYYAFADGRVAGAPALISRTGYTGEDGFELYLAPDDAPTVWKALLRAGAGEGLLPAGLGARDTLRLEAAMALYGHEIDDTTTPWEAGLDWTVKLKAGDFIGRDALVTQKEQGVAQRLVGFEVRDRGIARQGHTVVDPDAGGAEVGRVTSGTFSPTLERALGLAYVPTELAQPGTALVLLVRGRELAAEVVPTPFYKRP